MNSELKELTNEEFIEILDEENLLIEIAGLEYSPGIVLSLIDPITFQEEKSNYESSQGVYVCGKCKEEFEDEGHAENCCKIDKLVEMLERLGFEGIDVDLKISLLEYCVIYRESDGYTILCTNPGCLDDVDDLKSILFGSTWIEKSDILEAILEMPDSFFDYIGGTKKDYINLIYNSKIITIISDIDGYNKYLTGDISYNLDINDLLKSMQSEIDLIAANDAEGGAIDDE